MYKILRIVFCVLSACLVAACVFIFIYLGTVAGVVTLLGAALCFGLMLLFKHLQEQDELRKNPPPAEGDFFHPLPKDDSHNTDNHKQ
jgi:hypothetical protein